MLNNQSKSVENGVFMCKFKPLFSCLFCDQTNTHETMNLLTEKSVFLSLAFRKERLTTFCVLLSSRSVNYGEYNDSVITYSSQKEYCVYLSINFAFTDNKCAFPLALVIDFFSNLVFFQWFKRINK